MSQSNSVLIGILIVIVTLCFIASTSSVINVTSKKDPSELYGVSDFCITKADDTIFITGVFCSGYHALLIKNNRTVPGLIGIPKEYILKELPVRKNETLNEFIHRQ